MRFGDGIDPQTIVLIELSRIEGGCGLQPVRIGGDRFDEAIINYVRRNFGVLIGEPTAERIKHEIGSAYPTSEVREIEIKGRNLAEGVPRSFALDPAAYARPKAQPLLQLYPVLRGATALSAFLLIFVLALGVFQGQFGGVGAPA